MKRLAIAVNNVGNAKENNPFFYRHYTAIAPANSYIISFNLNDEGLDSSFVDGIRIDTSYEKSNTIKNYINSVIYKSFNRLSQVNTDRIQGFLIKNKIEVVLAEDGWNGTRLIHICNKLGIPLFVHFHGGDVGLGERKWYYRKSYLNLINLGVKGIIVPSKFLRGKLIKFGIPKEKIKVISCGIDTNIFNPIDFEQKDPYLVLAVGRLIPKKAPHLTIRAFSKVVEVIPNAKLEIIGSGRLLSLCKEEIQTLKLQDNVLLNDCNLSNDYVRRRMQEASVFCQHSVTGPKGDMESFGITPVEAMACGTPPVVTRHNGFVETILDNITGYLTPEFDVDEMAQKIVLLLQQTDLRKKMGEEGRKRVIDLYTAKRNISLLREIILK